MQDPWRMLGANSVHGSHESFLVSNQNKVIKQNLFKQLKDIVQKAKLTTYNSDILILEQLSLILYYYREKLDYGLKLNDYYLPRFDLIYPINLIESKDKVYRFRATYHFRHREGLSSNMLEQKVEEALKSNLEIPKLNILGDFPPFEELFKIINILLDRGYNVLKEHHFPYPDTSVIETKEFYEEDSKPS